MEIELSDVSGVPDAIKSLVAEKDGKHVLNLAQLAPAAEVDAYKGKALTAQQEAIDRRKALDAWKALGQTPDEVQAKLAKGADPAIIEQMRTEKAQLEQTFKQRLTGLVTDRAVADLKAELSKAGVVPGGLDLLATFAARQITVDDDGAIRIMSADGKPMIGQGANGGATLADLAKAIAATVPELLADKGTGGGGKPPGSNGATPKQTIKRADFDALSPQERRAALMAGAKVTD